MSLNREGCSRVEDNLQKCSRGKGQRLGIGSGVEHLPIMHKVLGSIPSTTEGRGGNERRGEGRERKGRGGKIGRRTGHRGHQDLQQRSGHECRHVVFNPIIWEAEFQTILVYMVSSIARTT